MYSTPWMSDIVVGTMRWGIWDAKFTTAQYEAMIDTSMSLGMSTFDHADIYGDMLGRLCTTGSALFVEAWSALALPISLNLCYVT